MYVCMYLCMYVCMYVCKYIYIYTFTWIDVCDYTCLHVKKIILFFSKARETLPNTSEIPCHMSSGENPRSSIYTG